MDKHGLTLIQPLRKMLASQPATKITLQDKVERMSSTGCINKTFIFVLSACSCSMGSNDVKLAEQNTSCFKQALAGSNPRIVILPDSCRLAVVLLEERTISM
jgi:hypothetical protein